MGRYGGLWDHDRSAIKGHPALIGVDEAGRGPMAGPVVAAAVVLEPGFFRKRWNPEILQKFDDSKKIPEPVRLELYNWLEETAAAGHFHFRSAEANVQDIQERNILHATALAMERAISTLPEEFRPQDDSLPLFNQDASPTPLVLVDGKPMKRLPYLHRAIVKGDGTSLAIAMASIVAKTLRDRIMVALDKKYPAYGFAQHKGYGTQKHRDALHQHGSCPEHRPKFLEKILGSEK